MIPGAALGVFIVLSAPAGGAGAEEAGREIPVPTTVAIPAGDFVAGSDRDEREAAYALDEAAYGHSTTRQGQWYEGERKRGRHETGPYRITVTPITNAEYAAFVARTGHRAPDVDPETWAGYGLIHPFQRTRRHAWSEGRPPPETGRPSGGDGRPR